MLLVVSLLGRALRLLSTVLCVVVLTSLGLWAIDQARAASAHQVGALGTGVPAPAPAQERWREAGQDRLREGLEDLNDVAVGPFTSLARSRDPWLGRIVPAMLAVFAYGVGLRMLARYLDQR